jgi:hypothetical protein
METDLIAEIRIDSQLRLCVRPATAAFPLIYRAAMEVHWDDKGRYLFSPAPREWSYARWFQQILAAVRDEYGYVLVVNNQTSWHGISSSDKSTMTSISSGACV